MGAWIGIFLLLFGLYLLVEPYHLPYIDLLFTWQSLFLLIGVMLVMSGMKEGKKGGSLLPGFLLIGIGLHYLAVRWIHGWPNAWYMLALLFGVAFFIEYGRLRNRRDLILSLLFFGIVAYNYYPVQRGLTFLLSKWWPVIIILIGAFLLIRENRGKRR